MGANWSDAALAAVLGRGHVREHSSVSAARVVRQPENQPPTRVKLPRPPRVPKPIVTLEAELYAQLEQAGYEFVTQYRWLPTRKFRADAAIIDAQLAIELEGAVHRIKKVYKADIRKRQIAMAHGWLILPILPEQVRSGAVVNIVRNAMRGLVLR